MGPNGDGDSRGAAPVNAGRPSDFPGLAALTARYAVNAGRPGVPAFTARYAVNAGRPRTSPRPSSIHGEIRRQRRSPPHFPRPSSVHGEIRRQRRKVQVIRAPTGVDVVGDAERRERAQALATLTRPGPRTGPSLQCPPFARARPPRNARAAATGPFLQMPAVRPGAPAPQRGVAAKRTLPSTPAVRRALRPARTRPPAPRRPGRNRPGRHRPSPPSNYAEQGESALLSPRPITSLRPTVTPSGRSHVSVHASTRPGVISSGPAGSHFASTGHGPAAR
jgi:hypothetical protein